MSEFKSVDVTCDCGHTFEMTQCADKWDATSISFPVCEIECPKCHRRASGGNGHTGEIFSWITQRELENSRMEYERQQFDCDMNEMYGRGEW